MANALENIITDPEYHWLLSQGKVNPQEVRQAYIDRVVAKDPEYQKLLPHQQRQVAEGILAIPDPPSEPYLKKWKESHPTGAQRILGALTPGMTAEDYAKQAQTEGLAEFAEPRLRAATDLGRTAQAALNPATLPVFFAEASKIPERAERMYGIGEPTKPGSREGIREAAFSGFLNEAMFGLPSAMTEGMLGKGAFPGPRSAGESVSSALGRLGGFILGPVQAGEFATKGLRKIPGLGRALSKLDPAKYDTNRAKEIAKFITREAEHLSAAVLAARAGDITAQRTLEDAAKEAGHALLEGAGMGAAFGGARALIPGMNPSRVLARILTINTLFQGKEVKDVLEGKAEVTPDKIAQMTFNTLLNSVFVLKNQRFPREYPRSIEGEPVESSVPFPVSPDIPETGLVRAERPLTTAMDLQRAQEQRLPAPGLPRPALPEGQRLLPEPEPREQAQWRKDLRKAEEKGFGEDLEGRLHTFPGPVGEILSQAGRAYTKQATRFYDWIADTKPGRLLKGIFQTAPALPGRGEYLAKRQRALGFQAKAESASKQIIDLFSDFDDAESKVAYEYLTSRSGTGQTAEQANAHRVVEQYPARFAKAKAVKRLIRNIGQGMVKRELMSQETFDKWRDQYLPRHFLEVILGQDAVRIIGSGKKLDLQYLKQRKVLPDELLAIYGEIKDPAFLAAKSVGVELRDLHLFDFMDKISRDKIHGWVDRSEVVEWNNRTYSRKAFMEKLANAERNMAHMEGEQKTEAARVIEGMKESLARTERQDPRPDYDPKNYKKMPDSPSYGPLKGLNVRKEIYDDVVGVLSGVTGENLVDRVASTLGPAQRVFKTMKVPLNVPGQIRNAVSNSVLMHMGGLSFHEQPKYITKAIQEMRTNGRYWNLVKARGVSEGTFSKQELFKLDRKLVKARAGRSPMWKAIDAYRIVADAASDVYQKFETVSKLAKSIHYIDSIEKRIGRRLTDAELRDAMDDAVADANKWLIDYSFVPTTVRRLRQVPFGAPFFTFFYKIPAIMSDASIKAPWRVVPLLLIGPLLEGIGKKYNDINDEEWETLKKLMPEWVQEKNHTWIMPYKNKDGTWDVVDVGYFLPWTGWSDLAMDLVQGDTKGFLRDTGLFGGPIPQIVDVLKTPEGEVPKDPYTGRDIYDRYDTGGTKLVKMLGWIWQLGMPPWLTESGFAGKMLDVIKGEEDYQGVEPGVGRALLRGLGVNVYRVKIGRRPGEKREGGGLVGQREHQAMILQGELNDLEHARFMAEFNGDLNKAEHVDSLLAAKVREAREFYKLEVTPSIN